MEGRSLVPAFANQPIERDALYWEHEGNAAIRVGDWKLVRLGRNGPWELYNLKTDRTELHDLAAAEPPAPRNWLPNGKPGPAALTSNPTPGRQRPATLSRRARRSSRQYDH
jgi:arylsulfatase A-like enzyme